MFDVCIPALFLALIMVRFFRRSLLGSQVPIDQDNLQSHGMKNETPTVMFNLNKMKKNKQKHSKMKQFKDKKVPTDVVEEQSELQSAEKLESANSALEANIATIPYGKNDIINKYYLQVLYTINIEYNRTYTPLPWTAHDAQRTSCNSDANERRGLFRY